MASAKSRSVAVVGCGQWGKNILRDFANLQALGAVVDSCSSTAEKAAAELLGRGYAVPVRSWESILDDSSITAVAIATPASQHANMAVEALSAGKHVFIEKPMAMTVGDGEHIQDGARKAGKTVMIGHSYQYHPAFLELKRIIERGKLGRILQISARRLAFGRIRHEENAFWNLAPHDISMILSLVGQSPLTVQARGEGHLWAHILDSVSANLTFANGVHAQIEVSWLYPEKERKLVVVGDLGMAVFDDCAPWETKLRVFRHGVDWSTGFPEPVKGDVETVPLDVKEPLAEECLHFLDCIRTSQQPRTDVKEAIAVVRVLRAVEEALCENDTRGPSLFEPTVRGGEPVVTTIHGVNIPREVETKELGVIGEYNGHLMGPNLDNTAERTPVQARKMIPLVDLEAQRVRLQDSLNQRIARVLDTHEFIMGPEVQELESRLAMYTGAGHAVTCASGTDALTLALLALRVSRGDAVIVPALTFVATVEPIVLIGAAPVIVDVDPHTLTIDPGSIAAGIEAAQEAGLRPVGVIAVDLYGQPADYESLYAAAKERKLWIIADAAQSFGASIGGCRVGTLADITTTSFFPSKPLGCYGDGGAIFTDNNEVANTLRSLRLHGKGVEKFDNIRIGMNSRLDTIQAAILLCKLEILAEEIDSRQRIASRYSTLLQDAEIVSVPVVRDGVASAWAAYTVRSNERSVLQARLGDEGISSAIYYPRPIHKQSAYLRFPVATGSCPIAEQACQEVLALPMHAYVEESVQQRIVAVVKDLRVD